MNRLSYERTRKISCKRTVRGVLIEIKLQSWPTFDRPLSALRSKWIDPVQLKFIWSPGSIRALWTNKTDLFENENLA